MRWTVAAAVLLCAAAYFIYLPLPPGVCEPHKLMLLNALFTSFLTAADLVHSSGLAHRIHFLNALVSLVEDVPARSSSVLEVKDISLGGVPTRVYRPWAGAQMKRGILYFHGGGWALGTAKMRSYDLLCRKMAEDLDAVIMSVDYSLAPDSVFPSQYLEALAASQDFLSSQTWSLFGLDPNRLCISGDSAGANLAAAVTQTLASDSSLSRASAQFKLQALVYPVLQALDFHTSSYQQNKGVPILQRPLMARFWLQYLGADPLLEPRLLQNQHTPGLDPNTRAKINWTELVPVSVRKHYRPLQSVWSQSGSVSSVFLDVRAFPLLADAAVLSRTPPAYVLTCEFDVLRDDGLMYAQRLRDAGVSVTTDHYDDGFHGCMVFANLPVRSQVGRRSEEGFIRWLHQNL